MAQSYLALALVAGKVTAVCNCCRTDESVVLLALSLYNAFCIISYTPVISRGQRFWCVHVLRFLDEFSDKVFDKVFVVWAFDMMHTICIISAVWESVITNFNKPDDMDIIPS